MAELKDKVVLITGSSSGIGEATALQLAELGAKLVITGLEQADVDKVVKRCLEKGSPEVESLVTDLSKDEDIQALVDATLKRFGTLHVLVNNAGANTMNDLRTEKGSSIEMDASYRLLLRAPWKLCGFFVDELIKNKGCIVNVASVLGTIPVPPAVSYCVIKAGQLHMTRCMATELGMQGVRVNAVSPGCTKTAIFKAMGIKAEKIDEVCNKASSKIHVLEQKPLEPDDVAKSIIFLASDAASRITGVNLPVDAGALLTSPAYDFSGSQGIPGLEQQK